MQKFRDLISNPSAYLQEGDMLELDGTFVDHYSIYVGNGRVVQLWKNNEVSNDPIDLAHGGAARSPGCNVYIYRHTSKTDALLAKCRALSRVGPCSYSLLNFNCEHFARACHGGTADSCHSNQVARKGGLSAHIAGMGATVGLGFIPVVGPFLALGAFLGGAATSINCSRNERGNFDRWLSIRNTALENKLRREHGLPELVI